MSLQPIGMFWDGPPLGFIERLCVKSFVDAGHPVVMFSYGGVENLPDGVEAASATDILPSPDTMVRHNRTGSPAPYSDKFRYHLLAKNDGMIWADTDAYCLKPFEPKDGYFFGRENDQRVANGVMALPAASPTLTALIDFCEDEYAIPPWLPRRQRTEIEARQAAGDPMHVSEMPWGVWGPAALSYYLKQHDEFQHALAPHVLYPVPYEDRRLYFRGAFRTWARVQEDTVSIHFYGRRCRNFLNIRFNGIPPENSILGELALKHGIALE
ncbi:MAG: hypothetical protein ACSHW1_04020 [Yoonia sp.]|uniref:hypothetical protein n=1 Tax=Yoonia sp. TaxID=2212373 RepID=UPI003EFAA382